MVDLPSILLEVPHRSMKSQRLLIILMRKSSVLQDLISASSASIEYFEQYYISNITEADTAGLL